MICAALTINRWQKSSKLCKALSNDKLGKNQASFA